MKKYWKYVMILLMIFLFVVIVVFYQVKKEQERIGKNYLYFPFALEQVENVEIYYFRDTGDIEKYVVTETGSIEYLYDTFQKISLKDTQHSDTEPWQVTAYRFNLTDDTCFEMVYEGYGVKNGILTLLDNKLSYFTTADLNKLAVDSLEPTSAQPDELPQY